MGLEATPPPAATPPEPGRTGKLWSICLHAAPLDYRVDL